MLSSSQCDTRDNSYILYMRKVNWKRKRKRIVPYFPDAVERTSEHFILGSSAFTHRNRAWN